MKNLSSWRVCFENQLSERKRFKNRSSSMCKNSSWSFQMNAYIRSFFWNTHLYLIDFSSEGSSLICRSTLFILKKTRFLQATQVVEDASFQIYSQGDCASCSFSCLGCETKKRSNLLRGSPGEWVVCHLDLRRDRLSFSPSRRLT